MKTLVAALAIAGSLLAAQAASAASYTFAFAATGENVSGTLTTSTTGASQLVTALSGLYNGVAISLVAPGGITEIPTNDNLIYPGGTGTGFMSGTSGLLDAGGLAFTSGSTTYNLYYNTSAAPSYRLDDSNANDTIGTGSFTLTPSAVAAAPEPGTWALMLGGVGLLGGMLRVMQARRREDEVKDIATA